MSEDIFFTRSWDWSNRRLNLKFLQGAGHTPYHVSKTGSDTTGKGSVDRPWLTIQKAYNTIPIAGGYTILVGAGTYAEDSGAINALRCDRTFLSTVTISPEAGAAVIITGVGDQGYSVSIASSCANLTFDGLNTGGASLTIDTVGTDTIGVISSGTSGVSNVTFRNLSITNAASSGSGVSIINGSQDGITFDTVTVTMSGAGSPIGFTLYGAAAGWITNMALTNCTVVGGQYAVKLLSNGRIDGLTITGGNYSTTLTTACAIGMTSAAFTGVIKNLTFSGVTITGLGDGIELGGTTGAHMSNITFTNCNVDCVAAVKTGVIIDSYVDTLTVTGGSFKGDGGPGRGGFFVIDNTVSLNTAFSFNGAAFYAAHNGPLGLGIGNTDGVTVRNCTFTGGTDARGLTIQNGTINVLVEDCVSTCETMGFRVGADSQAVYINDSITVRRFTINATNAPGMIVGSGVTNCLIENCTINGADSAMRLRGATTNSNIVIRNNTLGIAPGAVAVTVTALAMYGVRNVSLTGNIITSPFPSTFKNFLNGALLNQSNTITDNTINQSGGGVYDWVSANDNGGNVFDRESYNLTNAADFGSLLGTSGIANLAALQTVWDAYGDGTNENNSKMIVP